MGYTVQYDDGMGVGDFWCIDRAEANGWFDHLASRPLTVYVEMIDRRGDLLRRCDCHDQLASQVWFRRRAKGFKPAEIVALFELLTF